MVIGPGVSTKDRTERLAGLLGELRACGLVADPVGRFRLVVSHPNTPGIQVSVSCRPRTAPTLHLWFTTSTGRPISPAEDLLRAVEVLREFVGQRP